MGHLERNCFAYVFSLVVRIYGQAISPALITSDHIYMKKKLKSGVRLYLKHVSSAYVPGNFACLPKSRLNGEGKIIILMTYLSYRPDGPNAAPLKKYPAMQHALYFLFCKIA